jgi:hypothetical protein
MIAGWPAPQAPDQTPAVSLDARYRVLGAILGAGLAFGTMAALYAAASDPTLESLLRVREIFEPGMFGQVGDPQFAWAVAPLSGAVAAWHVAPRALAGDRWSGSAMGVLTYFVAILVGPIIVLLPGALATVGNEGIEAIEGLTFIDVMSVVPMIIVFGSVVLLPLAVICAAGGAVWAALLRAIVAASGGLEETLPSRPFDARPVVVLFALLAVGWFLLVGLMFGVLTGAEFVD